MKFTYLLLNLATIFLPFLFSFHPRLQFHRIWFAFFPSMLLTAAFFIVWDALFTSKDVWGFNPEYITGISLLHLPVEELLFFFCIPYASMFTYFCIALLIKKDILSHVRIFINIILLISLPIIAFLNYQKLYTVTSFLFLSAGILIFWKADFLSRFYLSYIILLLPFLIVNGILTGLFIPDEVVWYNNDEILGLRVLTIPVEDFFYGMLLLLLNTAGMEYLLERRKKK